MRPSHLAIGTAIALILGGTSAGSAQVLGLPVYNSGVPTGLGVYGDVAFPNGAAGDGHTLAASARLGISRIGVTATIASFNPSGPDNTLTSVGATGNYKLLGGPLIPFPPRCRAVSGTASSGPAPPRSRPGGSPSASASGSRSRTRPLRSNRGSRPGSTSPIPRSEAHRTPTPTSGSAPAWSSTS